MYESYNINNESAEQRQPSLEELKKREKEIKAEQKLRKKAEKQARKAEKKARGGNKVLKTIGLAAVFGIVASVVFQCTNVIGSRLTGNNTKVTENTAETVADEADKNEKVVEETQPVVKESKDTQGETLTRVSTMGDVTVVAQEAMPSIVSITNKSVQEVMTWYGMGIQEYESESAGSGIIIGQNDTELLVATNAHVVEGANTLTVCFIDESVHEAVIKGSDESNDLAVIAVDLNDIEGKTLEAIKIATIGDSETLQIGEQVVAIGNALGYGQSVTTGIISALDRDITDDDVENAYIQTDAAINPGNSGGALLNMNGELIGINSAKLASSTIEGMGYAIPISAAMPIMDGLMTRMSRKLVDEKDAGYIGISGFSVTKEVSKQYGIPEGIYVSEVTKGAAADKAGLQKGDIITSFDGMKMDSISKLRERLDYYSAGETVDITLYRTDNGQYNEMTFKITLDSRAGTPLDESSNTDDQSEEQPDDTEENNRSFRDFYNRGNDGGNIFDFFGY